MATAGVKATTSSIHMRIFNGMRDLFPQSSSILYRVFDGNQHAHVDRFFNASDIRFDDLPFFDNLFDNYRVIVSADGYVDAGLFPVKVDGGEEMEIELMLVTKNGVYNFGRAKWDALASIDTKVPGILGADLASADTAAQRWSDKFEKDSPAAACLLNILTIMANGTIAGGQQLLGFLKQVIWDDSMAQDRFFGWADRSLIARSRPTR